MRSLPGRLKGLVLVEPDVREDSRGFFLETYRVEEYLKAGIPGPFVQDNHSKSGAKTLRGLHGQLSRPQGKLLRVVAGEIFDVVVDARPDSHSYRQWEGFTLSRENFRQLYIPPGFLHGFCVLSPFAEVEYKCSEYYDATDEIGVRWNDPALGIEWPLSDPFLSERDKTLPAFEAVSKRFDAYRGMGLRTGE